MRFARSPGPGGQNVNKVATAVQLRVDVARLGLPDDVARRVLRLAGRRATSSGEILIEAHRFRTQERNREDAFARLYDLVVRARHVPRTRVPTKPTAGARKRRMDGKTRRGQVKRLRGKPDGE